MTDTLICWNCGTSLDEVLLPVSRYEYCPRCAEAVHCCHMCVHYSADAVDQCREDRAEPPADKTTANFCDFCTPRSATSGAEGAGGDAQAAKSRLDALFGGGPATPEEAEQPAAADSSEQDEARARLDALFGGGKRKDDERS